MRVCYANGIEKEMELGEILDAIELFDGVHVAGENVGNPGLTTPLEPDSSPWDLDGLDDSCLIDEENQTITFSTFSDARIYSWSYRTH